MTLAARANHELETLRGLGDAHRRRLVCDRQCVRTTASGSHVWFAIRLNGARVSSTRTLPAAKATAATDYAARVKEASGRRRREPSEQIDLFDAQKGRAMKWKLKFFDDDDDDGTWQARSFNHRYQVNFEWNGFSVAVLAPDHDDWQHLDVTWPNAEAAKAAAEAYARARRSNPTAK